MIYLDNAATTRVFESAKDAAASAMLDTYFNPNVTYKNGVDAKSAMEAQRRYIAAALGAKANELVFTSCATESNNWAIEYGRKSAKGNVVISAGEHPSVYEPAMRLKTRGIDVRIVPLTPDGHVDESAFTAAVDKNTTLVSVIHASNETGAVNPIKKLVGVVRAKAPRALFHSDGVQAAVKLGEPIDGLGVDLYSVSAHKLGAPKGIGLLYVRNGVTIAPMMLGGGQEGGARSGTQNTPYIAAFAAAVKEFKEKADRSRTAAIRQELADIFTTAGCEIVGGGENSGYVLCVCVPGVKAEILQNAVNGRGVIIGKGSACSGSKRGNRVLSAMGLAADRIESCIRLSFFADTSREDAISAAKIIVETASMIRSGNVR